MNRLFYPAIFHKEDGGFWISFPDFPECFPTGMICSKHTKMPLTHQDLRSQARQKEKEVIPDPTDISELKVDDGFLVVIEFDLFAYLKKHSSKAVKKTLTIPEWLNESATAMGLNFSQVLQEALMQKVQMK